MLEHYADFAPDTVDLFKVISELYVVYNDCSLLMFLQTINTTNER